VHFQGASIRAWGGSNAAIRAARLTAKRATIFFLRDIARDFIYFSPCGFRSWFSGMYQLPRRPCSGGGAEVGEGAAVAGGFAGVADGAGVEGSSGSRKILPLGWGSSFITPVRLRRGSLLLAQGRAGCSAAATWVSTVTPALIRSIGPAPHSRFSGATTRELQQGVHCAAAPPRRGAFESQPRAATWFFGPCCEKSLVGIARTAPPLRRLAAGGASAFGEALEQAGVNPC